LRLRLRLKLKLEPKVRQRSHLQAPIGSRLIDLIGVQASGIHTLA